MNNFNKIYSNRISNDRHRFNSYQIRTSLSDIKSENTSSYMKDNSCSEDSIYNHRRTARGSITYEEPNSDIGISPSVQRLPTYYTYSSTSSSDHNRKRPQRKQQLFISSSNDSLLSENRRIRVKERKKSSKQKNVAKRKLELSRGNPFTTISSQTAIADYQTSAAYGILGCDCDFQRFTTNTKQFPSNRTLLILDHIRSITKKHNNEEPLPENKNKSKKKSSFSQKPFGLLPASSLSNSNLTYVNPQKSLDEGLMYYEFNESKSEKSKKSFVKDFRNNRTNLHPLRSISGVTNLKSLSDQL